MTIIVTAITFFLLPNVIVSFYFYDLFDLGSRFMLVLIYIPTVPLFMTGRWFREWEWSRAWNTRHQRTELQGMFRRRGHHWHGANTLCHRSNAAIFQTIEAESRVGPRQQLHKDSAACNLTSSVSPATGQNLTTTGGFPLLSLLLFKHRTTRSNNWLISNWEKCGSPGRVPSEVYFEILGDNLKMLLDFPVSANAFGKQTRLTRCSSHTETRLT